MFVYKRLFAKQTQIAACDKILVTIDRVKMLANLVSLK